MTRDAETEYGMRRRAENEDGDRVLVSDGHATFWVDAVALAELVPIRDAGPGLSADEYTEWCVRARAREDED